MVSKKPSLEVCFSPALLDSYDINDAIVVVIDIFRATSTICTAIHHGAKEVIPVASVDECMRYKQKGFLVAGERDGKKVKGFDLGNSPFEYMNGVTKNKSIAITTTNGTLAIDMSKRLAKNVVAGSFLNLNVLCDWLKEENNSTVLLCAGWKNKFNLEDTLFAGAVVSKIRKSFNVEFDATLASKRLYDQAKNNLRSSLKHSSHYQRLSGFGYRKDMDYCLELNTNPVLPILKKDKLVKLS